MNSHQVIIFLVVAISIATFGVVMLQNTVGEFTSAAPKVTDAQVRVISGVGENISGQQVQRVRFEVVADEPVPINNTLITIRVNNASADYTVGN